MALVPSSANSTIVDPTIELQLALKDFETALAADQKTLYNVSVAKPGPEAVTLFVADIAARNQGSHGKFLWKRLCPFLEATRQFTGIINQFVSSNPSIAALVWGGVRTTILAAENASSYFAEVTDLLMEIGRSSPTLAEFGQLYTGHVGLQHALSKYYTIVVRVCIKIVKAAQRTTASHFLSSFINPFQTEFKPLLSEIAAAKQRIRDQISLAAKQASAESSKLLEHESKENEIHRRLANKFRLDSGKEYELMQHWRDKQLQLQNSKTRNKIGKRLSDIDYYKAWRLALQPTVPGTAEWFQSDRDFVDWILSLNSARIWCRGNMGAGKTLITANVISYLLKHKGATDVVAFHFCRSDEEASLKARAIIGTLARQILLDAIWNTTGDALDHMYEKSRSSVVTDIVDLILQNFKRDKTYYVIVDGLDECDSDDILEIRDAIGEFCKDRSTTIKILLTTRPDVDSRLFEQHPEYKLVLSLNQIQADIELYVDTTLDKCLENEALKLADPTLILRIAKTIKDGSGGMFLWALLLIRELCFCLSDREIIQSLDETPQGLSNLLDTILARIKVQKSATHVMRMLEYCGIAKRPLSMDELQEALSLEETQQSLDQTKMPTDMTRITSESRGLVFVDEIDNTIHYVHHSVKAYLFGRVQTSNSEFQEQVSDLRLGHMCLVYLNFSDFQRQIARANRYPDIRVPVSAFGLSPLAASSKVSNRIARKFLARRSEMQDLSLHELSRKAQEVLRSDSDSEIQTSKFAFLKYACTHWINHSIALDMETSPNAWNLFQSIVSDSASLADRPWSTLNLEENDDGKQMESLHVNDRLLAWAVVKQHLGLLRTKIPPKSVSDEDELMHIVDWTIGRQSHWNVARLIAKHVSDEKLLKKVMASIIADDDWDAVKFLRDAQVISISRWNGRIPGTAKIDRMWQPLSLMMEHGFDNRVTYLMDSQLAFTPSDLANALRWACCRGRVTLVEKLLPLVKDLNSANEDGITALVCAAACRNPKVFLMLLDAGADVNKADCNGLTPVFHWFSTRHISASDPWKAIDSLLQSRADFTHRTQAGWTLLMLAAITGKEKLVKDLIRWGVDVNAQTNTGKSALDLVSKSEPASSMMKLLQANGAKVGDGGLRATSSQPGLDSMLVYRTTIGRTIVGHSRSMMDYFCRWNSIT